MPVAAPGPALLLPVNVLHVTYIDATDARDSEECGRLRLGLFEISCCFPDSCQEFHSSSDYAWRYQHAHYYLI